MAITTRVLIIDDDEATLDIYSTLLARQNCGVILARDGRMGLLMAREYRPAVIILDMILPMIGGLELLRELKCRAETSAIPVFVLSNFSTDEYKRAAIDLGAEQYIVKTDLTPSQVWGRVAARLGAGRS